MSCYVMNSESIRKIGYTLADILNACKYNGVVTLDKSACAAADLEKTFRDCVSGKHQDYDPEKISKALHRLNAKAYASRYWVPDECEFAPRGNKADYSFRPVAGANGIPQAWHYHLARLLDCWLYQTAEGATLRDPLRLGVKKFAACLAQQIVKHSPLYQCDLWDE